ncbi:hypothetical protein DL765_011212 [Monosporascus sp. GIB2]|nr:hypothetical protein DL765_011212 [Monosporascus sp. GIB2]
MATNTPTTGSVVSRSAFEARIAAALDKCVMKEIEPLKRQRDDALRTRVRNHPEPMRLFHEVVADYGKRSATLLSQLRLKLQSVFEHTFDDLAVRVQVWDDATIRLQEFASSPSRDSSSSTQFGAGLAKLIHEYVTEERKQFAQERDEALRVGIRIHPEPFRFCCDRVAEYERQSAAFLGELRQSLQNVLSQELDRLALAVLESSAQPQNRSSLAGAEVIDLTGSGTYCASCRKDLEGLRGRARVFTRCGCVICSDCAARGQALRCDSDDHEESDNAKKSSDDAKKSNAGANRPKNSPKHRSHRHSSNTSRPAIRVVADRSLTIQGDTTNPTGQYVTSLIRPISSELGLRDFERDTVENAVRKMFEEAYKDPPLRSRLGLKGTITFESHTNLGDTDNAISEPMERVSVGGGDANAAVPAPRKTTRRKARGKGNRADQFCIYRTLPGQNVPTVAIEYKPPHKLSRDKIVTGLESEIQPKRDVIHKDGDGFAFASRTLATAVVTQLFSYMIGKGIQYEYVCTGKAFVFLFIPDDPTIVYYSVYVPNLDVMDDDEIRLHRTAIAQVFAFILQAVGTEPPPASWYDITASLDVWAVEYDDVLRDIHATVRKEKRTTPYKPQRWKGFRRSPIRTRSSCKQPDSDIGH